MTPNPGAPSNRLRRARLVGLLTGICLAVAACGGDSIATPSTICTPSLELGTPCIPADDSFVREAFDGLSTADEVNSLMDDGRFGGSLICAEKPSDSLFCSMRVDGATVVYPVEMPENRDIQFSEGGLDEPVRINLGEGVPVGVRYEGGSMRIGVIVEREVEGETINVEYYAVNTIEIQVPDTPAFASDEGGDVEADDAAEGDGE